MKDRYVDGAALREIRLRADLRQIDVAQRAAVGTQHLCRIEADDDYCSDRLARRLAAVLGVDLADFTKPGRHPRLAPPTRRAA